MRRIGRKEQRRIGAAMAGLVSAVMLSACGGQGGAPSSADRSADGPVQTIQRDGKDILVVYFAVAENSDVDVVSSASMVMVDGEAKGRVRHLADLIGQETGGELFAIETSARYPGDGETLVDYAAEEQDADARPMIVSHIEDLDQYDVVFVGYPTWWYDLPQVMYSFFDEYDFSGKTIIPFNTHNGSRFSGTIQTIRELESDAEVIEDGFTVNERDVAEAGADIASWLQDLGF